MAKFTAIFDLEDKISRKIERMTKGLERAQAITERLNKFDINAVDKATPKIEKMRKTLGKNDNHQINLNAKDNTKRALDQANRRMRALPANRTTLLLADGRSAERTVRNVSQRVDRLLPTRRDIVIAANTNGFNRQLAQTQRRVNRYIPPTVDVTITARDRVTAIVNRISNRVRTGLSKGQEYVIRARDEASRVVNRVNNFARRSLSRGYTATISTIDRFTTQANRIASRARSMFARPYNAAVGLIDRATPGMQRISNFANNNLRRTFTMTVKVADLATRPLRKIGSLASSTGAMLGLGAGTYGGVVAPLQAQAQRQNMTTAFETLLGSREAAEQRLDDLISFAGQTPFARDEIFEASRVLEIFTGGALAAGDGMKLVGDIAAGTQKPFADVSLWVGRMYDGLQNGRPIGDAMAALQEMGAISGASRAKLEELAESGRDISEIWPEATKEFERFDDMMLKMSDNLANLTLGAKSFVNNAIIMPWGAGLASVVQPSLEAFRTWRTENGHVIAEMTKQMEVAGQNFAQAIMNPMGKTFGFIGDQLQILFPGELTSELQEKFKDDPALEKRFKELDAYRDMTLKARWDIVWDNSVDVFGTWWNEVGEPGLLNMVQNAGSAYGGILNGIITGLLQIDDEATGNAFVDAGAAAGRTFIGAFIEAIDPIDIGAAIGKKLWDVNYTAAKSNVGRVIGQDDWVVEGANTSAAIANLAIGGVVAFIASKFLPALRGATNVVKFFGKHLKNIKLPTWLGGGGKGPKQPRVPTTPVPTRVKVPNAPTTIDAPNRRFPQIPDWMKKTGKRIPVLGSLLAGGAILTGGTDNLGSGIGSLLGGMAGGAAAGAAVGSVAPGVGTLIGGTVGAIGGAIGGEKLGNWVQHSGILTSINETLFSKQWWSDKWTSVKEWASSSWSTAGTIWEATKTVIGSTLFSGVWWSTQWTKVTDGAKEMYEGSWLDRSLSAIGNTVFSGEWWGNQWTKVTDGAKGLYEGSWLDSAVSAIGDTLFNADWWIESWEGVKQIASRLADPAFWSFTLGYAIGLIEETLFSGEWWSAKWDEVVSYASKLYEGSWMDNALTKIGETIFNGEWWSEKWSSVVEGAKALYEDSWMDNTVTAIGDSLFNSEWWAEKWDNVKVWATEKAIQIGAIGWSIAEGISDTLFNSEWWAEKWDAVKAWTQGKWDSAVTIWNSVTDKIGSTVFNTEWWSEKWDNVTAWAQQKWDAAQVIWDSVKTRLGDTIFSSDWWNEKWSSVVAWSQGKWDSAQVVWDSVTSTIGSTIFSSEWWGNQWSNVTDWTQQKWDSATDVWDSVTDAISNSIFSYDWWVGKWNDVLGWGKDILGSIGGWLNDTFIQPFSSGREAGKNKGQQKTETARSNAASNRRNVAMPAGGATPYANGGIINRPHLGLVGEAGPEAIIPLSMSRRGRALDLYEQAGRALGVKPYANGGIVGSVGSSGSTSPASATAQLTLDRVRATGLQSEAEAYGQQFSESIANGANSNVISLDAWKQRNIVSPMSGVVQEAVGFGTNTVSSFAQGQFATPTNTQQHLNQQVTQPFQSIQMNAPGHGSRTIQGYRSGQNATLTGTQQHLENQVNRPFQVIQGGASAHGVGTIQRFRAGQDASQTGTQSYLQRQVDTPFNQTKGKGQGWGSELIGEFVTGMRSKEADVTGAAKILADAVEKTFRERLGIHSPSRVMMSLGRFASLGIVKGLDSIDLEKFADKQVTGLIGVYAGQAPNFGSAFTMTSGFGPRKSPGGIGTTDHRGVDFAAPMGTPIPAQAPGIVSFAGWQGGFGNLVKIQGADGLEYLYGHNSKNLVKKGDMVSRGQTIGLVGSTGNSTGPHVHYEVRKNGVAFNPMAAGASLFGGSGANTSTRNAVAQAALATGVGKDWIEPLMTIAMKESGGNARAVNNWDSNARRGTPSKGLMQTIDPTFNAHKLPGMDDIFNPVHNTAAAIRYIQSRYGDISNVPGIKSMRNGGSYRGYANGGLITHDHIARVGEGGRREWIIPGERGIRGRYLLGQAANDLGMQVVGDEHYEVPDNVAQQLGLAPRQSSGQQQTASSTSTNNQEISPTINVYITGDNNYHNDTDVDLLLSKMKNELVNVLRNMRTNYSLGVNDG